MDAVNRLGEALRSPATTSRQSRRAPLAERKAPAFAGYQPEAENPRAHGLIRKVPKTYRCQVTSHGRLAITAVLTMNRTSIAVLNKAAA